jgi:mono/diheme cytochrome c family protein
LSGRISVAEPRYYVAAQPRRPSEAKSQVSGDGEKAFQDNCTTCHDAQRSFEKRKTLAGWRATVETMAKKPDADIPEVVREPIAKFLSVRAGAPEGEDLEKNAETGKSKEQTPKFDPALVQQGTTAFNSYCTTCHGAEKALQVSKSLSAWRSTVRRMSEKDGANIPENTHEAIATYLASLSSGGTSGKSGGGEETASPLTINGTISPSYRYSGNQNLEYPGHFGDAWIGFAWQSKSPVSARVTTCISCHTQGLQLGNIELVEASVRFDVSKALCPDPKCPPVLKVNVEAGRFVVPFGAYHQEVNPGVDRAVSKPLIYNMGERVEPTSIGDPVLPMPYCDEGASINLAAPLGCDLNTTFNAYMVNGLEGNINGIDFFESRDYVDNNRWPAAGGRATIGGQQLRLGCSIMGGRFNPDTGAGPQHEGMNYLIFGADATYHWKDVFRFQFEYAQRNSDRFATLPNNPQATVFNEHVSGFYFESELLVLREEHVSLFARYESLYHDSPLPVLGSQVATGSFGVNRFTYGVNWTLPGGSLLMINHEYWDMPHPLGSANVVGMRWAATF